MKTYTKEELQVILDNHKKWLNNNDDSGTRADLRNADLSGADLRDANLRNADLSGADLRDANLRKANLSGADLRDAYLRNANLSGAYFSRADLRDANLRDADLRKANLRKANLSGADLRDANLSGANLCGVTGDLIHVKSLQTEKYYITYTSKVIQIGCQSHTIEEWKNFDDEKIRRMDIGALDWWNKWKPVIMQIIEMSPCEETKYA